MNKEKLFPRGGAEPVPAARPPALNQELLMISAGIGSHRDCQKTIGGIASALQMAFPGWPLYRASASKNPSFTGEGDSLKKIDTVSQAMDWAIRRGVKVLTIQPTHMSFGMEFHDLVHELAEYYGDYEQITIGQPLLSTNRDFQNVAKILVHAMEPYCRDDTAICCIMRNPISPLYDICVRMQDALRSLEHGHFYVGILRNAEGMCLTVATSGVYRRVVLLPLTMALDSETLWEINGTDSGSWRQTFSNEGYEVICFSRGLGEMEPIRDMIVGHTRDAMRILEQDREPRHLRNRRARQKNPQESTVVISETEPHNTIRDMT